MTAWITRYEVQPTTDAGPRLGMWSINEPWIVVEIYGTEDFYSTTVVKACWSKDDALKECSNLRRVHSA
jgi:hypothetical protein